MATQISVDKIKRKDADLNRCVRKLMPIGSHKTIDLGKIELTTQ